jgi:hypothetical protein
MKGLPVAHAAHAGTIRRHEIRMHAAIVLSNIPGFTPRFNYFDGLDLQNPKNVEVGIQNAP